MLVQVADRVCSSREDAISCCRDCSSLVGNESCSSCNFKWHHACLRCCTMGLLHPHTYNTIHLHQQLAVLLPGLLCRLWPPATWLYCGAEAGFNYPADKLFSDP